MAEFPKLKEELLVFQSDVIDLQNYSNHNNNGWKFIVVVIDTFSRYAFARALRTKEGNEVANAVRSILESDEMSFLKPPKYLMVDRGGEFYCDSFKDMLEDFGIHMYCSGSNVKASMAERFIRTLKSWMFQEFSARGSYKWTNILDDLMK